MLGRLAAAVLLAVLLRGCVHYEYEHEFWLQVDGSGSVVVAGQPRFWAAFKGLQRPGADAASLRQAARELFERSGLRVQKVKLTRREGQPQLYVAAEFTDVNRLSGTPAFPDLEMRLRSDGQRLTLDGAWRSPQSFSGAAENGLIAVRFHLPSKVYAHRNAFSGVERGNIVSWRQDLAQGLAGQPLAFGAVMDRRSILLSTVSLFGAAIVLGAILLGLVGYWLFRMGRRRGATVVVTARPRPGG